MVLLGDWILVKEIKKEKTDSGIILAEQRTFTGFVEAIGVKVKHIKIGDKIRFYEHSGQKIEKEGKDYLLMSEKKDVIAIMDFIFPDDIENENK